MEQRSEVRRGPEARHWSVVADDARGAWVLVRGLGDTYGEPGFWQRLADGLAGVQGTPQEVLRRVHADVRAEILAHWAPNGHGRVLHASAVVACRTGPRLEVASVGATVAWLQRDGAWTRLTRSHTLLDDRPEGLELDWERSCWFCTVVLDEQDHTAHRLPVPDTGGVTLHPGDRLVLGPVTATPERPGEAPDAVHLEVRF